jgi:hypothetical protein
VDGKTMLPQMYGDPRGHKQSGQEQWYQWTPNLHIDQLIDVYMMSMDRRDLERVPKTGWIGYLEGEDKEFPEKALRRDLEFVRKQVAEIRLDPTSPDTRLADYVQGFNPAAHDALAKLTLGANLSGNIWSLHARFRYFDPEKRRAGLPDHVAALVTKLGADSAKVTLVNTDNVEPKTVVVQAGGYAEHEFTSVTIDGKDRPLGSRALTVRLAPGAGAELSFQMKRYAHAPTASVPWER